MVHEDTVQVYPTVGELVQSAAELVNRTAAAAVARHGRFNLVLSGGSTPRPLFKLLARDYREAIPWRKTHVFWSDERYVAPDHPESNFAAAESLLLQHVPVPPEQVHRVPTDFRSRESAAIEHEIKLHSLFPDDNVPGFDLALLGMGEDGHTASLFPGANLADERWVAPVFGPAYQSPRERITLTMKALNGARVAAFLVAGIEKHDALQAVLTGSRDDLPAAAVRPKEELLWLVDAAAHDAAG